MFSLIPCTLFLSSQSIAPSQIADAYTRLMFEKSVQLINTEELSDIYTHSKLDPEALFKINEGGDAERDVIRAALKQLRLVSGANFTEVAPMLLRLLEVRLKEETRETETQNKILENTAILFSEFRSDEEVLAISPQNPIQNSDLFLIVKHDALKIWNTNGGRQIESIPFKLPAEFSRLSAHLTNSAKTIAVSYRTTGKTVCALYNRDLKTWTQHTFAEDSVPFSVSINGDYALIQERAPTSPLFIWNFKTDQRLEIPPVKDSNGHHRWRRPTFGKDNLVVVSYDGTEFEHLNPDTGQILKILHVDTPNSDREVVSHDGSLFFRANHSAEWTLWDSSTQRLLAGPIKRGEDAKKAHFSKDSNKLIVTHEYSIVVWGLAEQQFISSITAESYQYRFKEAVISPDNRFIAAIIDQMAFRTFVVVYDAKTGAELKRVLQKKNAFETLSFSSDGRALIVQTLKHEAFVWDVEHLLSKETAWDKP